MQIFKNKFFHRWAKEFELSDNKLKEAVIEISKGLYEANLGGIFLKRASHWMAEGKVQGHAL